MRGEKDKKNNLYFSKQSTGRYRASFWQLILKEKLRLTTCSKNYRFTDGQQTSWVLILHVKNSEYFVNIYFYRRMSKIWPPIKKSFICFANAWNKKFVNCMWLIITLKQIRIFIKKRVYVRHWKEKKNKKKTLPLCIVLYLDIFQKEYLNSSNETLWNFKGGGGHLDY